MSTEQSDTEQGVRHPLVDELVDLAEIEVAKAKRAVARARDAAELAGDARSGHLYWAESFLQDSRGRLERCSS